MTKISYAGYRFPPEIIQQAIWLYLRFTLSFRDVEGLCHIASATSTKCHRLMEGQAAATAVRHVLIAGARSTRCVWVDVRWRWTLKVL